MRNKPVIHLVYLEVLQPLHEESGAVHEKTGCGSIYLNIPCPAHLLPLRAVAGDLEKVAFLRPEDIVMQLIDKRIGA
jgi:hypothetical protein